MLTPERWQLVERVFLEALACPLPERQALIDSSCGSDPELFREVESLLAAASDSDSRASLMPDVAAGWATERSPDALVGREIDSYRVLSLLGAGGMGEVYLAEDLSLGRRVALKLLPTQFNADPGRLRRFTEEARAASALNHPNIITVYEIGVFEEQRFIATEFIDGETLRERIGRGPLAPADAMDIAAQVGRALGAAHAAGIVHRDIKPENIMIRRDGYVKVLDFGLAKLTPGEQLADRAADRRTLLTRAGAVLGTLDYMAPEQAAGGTVDVRADLYSLSVVLHEMITGERPGGVSDSAASVAAPHLPKRVARVLERGLTVDVAARYQAAEDLTRDLEAIQQSRLSAGARPRRLRRAVAAALGAVAVAIGVTWRVLGDPPFAPIDSIAVLPFDVIGGDRDTAYLHAAMTDALTTRLAAIGSLRVPPTAAVRRFARGPDVAPHRVGQQLGVDAVLTGGVERTHDQIRVTVQVTRAADASQIWASAFEAPFTGIFALQDEIAGQVAANLMIDLSDAERVSLRSRETSDPEAYELYLQGRQVWEHRTPETVRTAIVTFTRAIERDPQFARAHAWLANAYAITASGLRPTERFPLAKAAALKAIELDERLADGHNALAFLTYKWDWNWTLSEREFKRAIELNPTFVLARHWYGEFLGLRGRFDEAIEQFRVARELEPHSVSLRVDLSAVLHRSGRADVALQLLDDGLAINPLEWKLYSGRAAALNVLGRSQEAFEDTVKSRQLVGASPDEIAALRKAYAEGGVTVIHRQNIAFMRQRLQPERPVPFGAASMLGVAYGAIGDREATLEWLERAADLKEDAPLLMKVEPNYRFLHGDRRFQALMRRVGLADGQP